jgi:Flp pilus assembly protein TadD
MDSQWHGRLDIERASELLSAGKAVECAALSGAILAREPKNAIAAHLLGLALKETGDWEHGEQWLRFSIRLEPERPEFHSNLANLLRREGKFFRAERVYRRALNLAPDHRAARRGLAVTLCDLGRPEEAEIECRALLASDESDVESWVLLAMTLADNGRLAEAEAAYRRAIVLDPSNRVAHHNLGALLSRLDKPELALESLDRAAASGAAGYELAFNRGRAYLDLNELDAAEREFDRAVALQPKNTGAQAHLARIRYMRGDPRFARALAAAAATDRNDFDLQLLLGQLLWRAGNLVAAETMMHDILARAGPHPQARSVLAGVLLDAGMLVEAEAHALEAASLVPNDPDTIETLVTILLSRGRPEDAVPFIQAQRSRLPDSQAWIAYEATAARALGRDAHGKLYDYDRFVRAFDVEAPSGWSSMAELNRALVTVLEERHRFNHHPLEQTLRNGTQTSRSLLTDRDPIIQAVLQAFADPIADYRASLGRDPAHPLTARNHGAVRFTGAWSVRLHRQGFHVNHFHPDGWISSAYYVDVPPETKDTVVKSGWIKFGEPRYPVRGLAPERFVQPSPGRLVLFPSYMWHGTNAIQGDAPRVTIAFDITPDRATPD